MSRCSRRWRMSSSPRADRRGLCPRALRLDDFEDWARFIAQPQQPEASEEFTGVPG
jgi:hypothetical protein